MDITRYDELKAKGVMTIEKLGDAYVILSKRFDPDTGDPLPTTFEALDKNQILQWQNDFTQRLKTIDNILTDLEQLDKQPIP